MENSYLPSIVPATATFLAFLLFLYHLLWKPRRAYNSLRKPPEAGGGWPVVGHLPLLGGSQPPHITLGDMADKYGPIFTIRMGVHRALIVSNSEMAKECFTTNDKVFANRPKSAAAEHMAYDNAMFGFSPYGPYWRQVRKIATLELLSSHRLQTLGRVRESEVKTAIKEIYELCVKNDGVELEMKKWFGVISLNTMFKIVVGKRYADAVAASSDGIGDDRFTRAIRDFFELTGAFVPSDVVPFLRWLDLGGYVRAMKKTAKELDQVLQEWLEEHKRSKGTGSGEGDEQDFMGVMLSVLDDAEEISSYDVDTINKATCLAFILAGTDTTTVTMTWALALLLNNRDTLKKAQQELDEHIGRDRQVKETDMKNLVYLQAILKETLRLYPGLPLLVPHQSSKDCTIGGYYIPGGTRLLVNVSKIQRDPNFWSEPCEFRPERFLTTHQNVDIRGQNFELMPFGCGRRMCPGISFSLQVMMLTLAALLHGFDIETTSDEPVDMRGTIGLAYLKASPLDVILTPRLPRVVYQ